MKIEILGSGCPKCHLVENIVKEVVNENKIKAAVEHVYDIEKIIDMGVTMSPAISVDGKVIIQGKIPAKEEVLSKLKLIK